MARARVKNTGVAKSGVQPRCGRCAEEIRPGEQRYEWHFRYGGRRVRCMEHPPRPSELTQSEHLSNLYSAREALEDLARSMSATGTPDTHESLVGELADVEGAISDAAETAREAAEAYSDAAEHFGGAGENAERAESAEAWADELDGVELPQPPDEPDDTCEECEGAGVGEEDEDGEEPECEACHGTGKRPDEDLDTSEMDTCWQEAIDAVEAAAGALEL